MTSLKEQLVSYGAYHKDPRNKLTHFVGVPLVTFSLFLVLSWFRFAPAPDWPITGATLFFLVVFLYYLRLDWPVALLQAPVNLVLLALGPTPRRRCRSENRCSMSLPPSWAAGSFNCWTRHRRPATGALADNLLQIFNAPLFLTVEVLFLFGLRQDLREA